MLELNNVNKEFFEGFKIKDVSFKLEPGYIMGFIGPNGSGKSTIIKLIMNLLRVDSGEIKIFGKDHRKDEVEIKDRIGFVYDESYFYENLTIEKMKDIIAPFYTQWNENTFNNYLKTFGLKPNYVIKKLSKGMKMQFSIALALSHNADLIIMDEPTAGLDPIIRREVLDILYNVIQDEKKSVFLSTHITTDLEKIADYITYIKNGKLVFSKSMEDTMESYALVKGGPDQLNENVRKVLIGVRETNVGFEALTENPNAIKTMIGEDLLIERPTLEDIMYYTRGE